METTKISFGFKLAPKSNLLPIKKKEAPKVVKELIKCLEGQEIRLVEEKQEEAPLVIQMQGTQKTSTALASLMKRRAVLLGEDENNKQEDDATNSKTEIPTILNENLDQRAARELLAQLQPNGESIEQTKLVLPVLKADELPLDGAKQSTLDDYEAIPIQQYGLAMLRGMGWVEPPKKKGGPPLDEAPMLRPKGMGLGADKALKAKPLLVQPAANEVLEIKKLAFVRILGGKHKDAYGQIEGFDDHAGRVIVKMAIGGAKEAFNEFLCQPVTKKEFTDYGKCINSVKYEEYKNLENEHGQIVKKEKSAMEPRQRSENVKIKEEKRDYKKEMRDDYVDYKNERRSNNKNYRNDQRNIKYDKGEFADSSRDKNEKNQHYNVKNRSDRSKDLQNRNYDDRNRGIEQRSRQKERQSIIEESDDASDSTESDSDSAYERKYRKKSTGSSKSRKHKSKKSKSKSRRRSKSSSRSCDDDDGKSLAVSSDDDERKYRKANKHKKKSKKSKHARSRSRSRR